jgi:hypothetical protein
MKSMFDTRFDIPMAFAIAIPATICGWILVRIPRNRLAAGILVVVGLFYVAIVFGLLTKRFGIASAGLVLGAPVSLVLGLFGIAFRKVTFRPVFILSQVVCWLLVSIPVLFFAFAIIVGGRG